MPSADVAAVQRLVPAAAAGHECRLSRHGASARHDVRVREDGHEVGVRSSEPLHRLVHDVGDR